MTSLVFSFQFVPFLKKDFESKNYERKSKLKWMNFKKEVLLVADLILNLYLFTHICLFI